MSVTVAHYERQLEDFKTVCLELIANGMSYQAIVLNHELYRFLYPIEPYANFEHKDPANFLSQHLTQLCDLGRTLSKTISGYDKPEVSFTEEASAKELEIKTSDLYSSLWKLFSKETLAEESRKLVENRIPEDIIAKYIKGKNVLDMGCGSGRYSIALAGLGAKHVTAVDFQAKAFTAAEEFCKESNLPVVFQEANVLELPFADAEFDFVYSNGVLHHSRSWTQGVSEFNRVMKTAGYLYLYATGGFFWTGRRVMREIFTHIPEKYTRSVLKVIGLPSNRFIFMDTWYVPVEGHIVRSELINEFDRHNVKYDRLYSDVEFDPDYALKREMKDAEIVWGEGEHRYLLTR